MEGDVASGVVGFHGFGEQAVQRERLVVAPHHQALEHEAAFEREAPDLLHGDAPDDQRVEAVEGPEHALHQPAALRGVGIGVGHMGEIGRHRRRAMHGDRVTLGGLTPCRRCTNGSRAKRERNAGHDYEGGYVQRLPSARMDLIRNCTPPSFTIGVARPAVTDVQRCLSALIFSPAAVLKACN